MKKFVSIIAAALILSLSCLPVFAEKEGGITAENYVDAKNSGFEDAKSITDTGWFRLVSSTGGDTNGIELKTDGGHTGKNYIQAKIEQSWYSPAINIYPFLKEAGEGTYRIAVYMRSSDPSFAGKSAFVVRGKEADISGTDVFPFIVDRGSGNFYGSTSATCGDPDENKWILFVSTPFDVDPESLIDDHSWWFCVDTLKKDTTLDFDDFGIYRDDEFEDPNDEVEEMVKTDISYLTEDAVSKAFPAAEKTEIVTPAPDNNNGTANGGTNTTPAPATKSGNSYLLVYILVPVCVLIAAGAAGFIIVKKKK